MPQDEQRLQFSCDSVQHLHRWLEAAVTWRDLGVGRRSSCSSGEAEDCGFVMDRHDLYYIIIIEYYYIDLFGLGSSYPSLYSTLHFLSPLRCLRSDSTSWSPTVLQPLFYRALQKRSGISTWRPEQQRRPEELRKCLQPPILTDFLSESNDPVRSDRSVERRSGAEKRRRRSGAMVRCNRPGLGR